MKNNIKRSPECPNCYLGESSPELVDVRAEIQSCTWRDFVDMTVLEDEEDDEDDETEEREEVEVEKELPELAKERKENGDGSEEEEEAEE